MVGHYMAGDRGDQFEWSTSDLTQIGNRPGKKRSNANRRVHCLKSRDLAGNRLEDYIKDQNSIVTTMGGNKHIWKKGRSGYTGATVSGGGVCRGLARLRDFVLNIKCILHWIVDTGKYKSLILNLVFSIFPFIESSDLQWLPHAWFCNSEAFGNVSPLPSHQSCPSKFLEYWTIQVDRFLETNKTGK